MLGRNGPADFFRAPLQIANERLTPYQVYSFEPGFDREIPLNFYKSWHFLYENDPLFSIGNGNFPIALSHFAALVAGIDHRRFVCRRGCATEVPFL